MTPTFEVFQIELTSNERDIYALYKNDSNRENQQFATAALIKAINQEVDGKKLVKSKLWKAKDHDALLNKIMKKTNCDIDEINFHEFRDYKKDNTYDNLLKEPFYKFHEKRIREDIQREGDLDKLYDGL
jgi:5'-3' exonuclease